jgi:hypothetical protein
MIDNSMNKAVVVDIHNIEEHSTCLISYEIFKTDTIDKNPIIELVCGHRFYYDNILMSYLTSSIYAKRVCPYCRRNGGYLPYIKDTYIKRVHSSRTLYKTIFKKQCDAIILTGKNKGSKCTFNAQKRYHIGEIYYCGRHKHLLKNNNK